CRRAALALARSRGGPRAGRHACDEPCAVDSGHAGIAAGPGHDPSRQDGATGILRGRRELHRLPNLHARRGGAHRHRCYRYVRHRERGGAVHALARRRDRRRAGRHASHEATAVHRGHAGIAAGPGPDTPRPGKGAPVESCSVAVNCTACATISVAAAGVTATVFTGTGVTVTAPESVPPPLVAVTLYFPS